MGSFGVPLPKVTSKPTKMHANCTGTLHREIHDESKCSGICLMEYYSAHRSKYSPSILSKTIVHGVAWLLPGCRHHSVLNLSNLFAYSRAGFRNHWVLISKTGMSNLFAYSRPGCQTLSVLGPLRRVRPSVSVRSRRLCRKRRTKTCGRNGHWRLT
jgi:hypothetical protein